MFCINLAFEIKSCLRQSPVRDEAHLDLTYYLHVMATLIIRPQFPELLLRFITRDYNTDEVGSQHDRVIENNNKTKVQSSQLNR